MVSAYPNKTLGGVVVALMLLLAAATAFAAAGDRGGGSSPPRGKSLPVGCWVTSDGFVHSQLNGTGPEKIFNPFCIAADGAGPTVVKPICKTAPAPYTTQFIKGITTFECPNEQVCDQGACVVKLKPIGCYDSDAPGKSDLSTWGSWLDKYNPQIKTPGFVKMETITGGPPNFVSDSCKDNYVYEQACVDTPPPLNFQQKPKKVPVKCPEGYWCQNIPITDVDFMNPGAKGNGAPTTAGACVPKPDPCDAPWNDMCPDVEGCQKDPNDCPAKKDICDSTLTKEELQSKYGPNTSIFPMVSGGWVADSCVTTYTIKHEWCENGVPKSGISPCPPGTCAKGLCGDKQVPLPGGKDNPASDCFDTDINGSTNGYGKLDQFGKIILKGAKEWPEAYDNCKAKKIVEQFKCDALNPKGFSNKTFTCTGKDDCCGGVCFLAKEPKCEEFTPTDGMHGAKGTDKKGDAFNVVDTCTMDGKLSKVTCDLNGCLGYAFKEPEFCPDGKTCKAGLCIDKNQKSCGPLPDGSGVGVIENGKVTEFKNKCVGSITTTWVCDATGNAKSTDTSCATGCNPSGICSACNDTDPQDDVAFLGTVKWLDAGKTSSGNDFCDTSGKLVQVQCINNSKGYSAAAPCPAGKICQNGICLGGAVTPPNGPPPDGPPDDKCKNVAIDDGIACTIDSCSNGVITHIDACSSKPEEQLPVSQCTLTCDQSKGQFLDITNCVCDSAQDLCKLMGKPTSCANGQFLDFPSCSCKVDPNKNVPPGDNKCSPENPNGSCPNPGDSCYNGKCQPDLCAIDPAKSEIAKTSGDVCKLTMCNNGKVTWAPKCSAPQICTKSADGLTAICVDPQALCTKNGLDDQDACTTDTCDQTTGNVSHTAVKEGASEASDKQCFDDDKDDITNSKDNCPKLYNPKQEDVNQNKVGDICELVLSAGSHYACATFADKNGMPNGDLKCWGSNNHGELGSGKISNYEWAQQQVMKLPDNPYATPTEKLTDIRSADGGYADARTCATNAAGSVYCWGYNDYGAFSLLPNYKIAAAVLMPQITTATAVAVGLYPNCALTKDGKVMCWGHNWVGSLGIGAGKKGLPTPQWVVDPTNADGYLNQVTSLSAYHSTTCAVLENGTIKCWGDAKPPLEKVSPLPTTLPSDSYGKPLSNVLKIALGFNNACVLKKDQTVACKNKWQQKFNLESISNATDIAVSAYEACATTKDGSVYCWNAYIVASTPIKISAISGATQLVAGHDFFCARVADLSVKCWGNNDYGQLGYPPFGLPSCVAADPYGKTAHGCADTGGKKLDTALICDAYGTIDCKQKWVSSNTDYQITCPNPAAASDLPKCVKIDFGIPTCLGPIDTYGKPTPKCSNDVGKVTCDPYGNPSCAASTPLSNYKPLCSDPNTPPSCIKPSVCGNYTVEAGEQCDDGWSNGGLYSKCTSQCMFKLVSNPYGK